MHPLYTNQHQMSLEQAKARTEEKYASLKARSDKLRSGIIPEVTKEIFKNLPLIILVGGILTGSWVILGPTAAIIAALGILFIGYIELRIKVASLRRLIEEQTLEEK